MKKKILLIGAKGTAKMIIEMLEEEKSYSEIALLDNFAEYQELFGYPIIGKADDLEKYSGEYTHAFVCIADPKTRALYLPRVMAAGFTIPNFIHPRSYVSKTVIFGIGTFINAMAVVQSDSRLGNGCFINTAAKVSHDCTLGDYVHMAINSSTTGYVSIDSNTFVGASSCIIGYKHIGKNVTIAAGAAVITDVPDNVMVAGCPAVIKKCYKEG